MIEIRNLFHEGGSPADLRYKEEERKRRREIAEKTVREEYTLDWSQSKVFLVHVCNFMIATDCNLIFLCSFIFCILYTTMVCYCTLNKYNLIWLITSTGQLCWSTGHSVLQLKLVSFFLFCHLISFGRHLTERHKTLPYI